MTTIAPNAAAATIPAGPGQGSQALTLTIDQQAALDAFVQFLLNPTETVFTLSGYSGCGKSTLISVLLDRLPNYIRTAKLINPSFHELTPVLTATTNKAAENLSHITGWPVSTIHSCIGLRVQNDFRNNTTELIPKKGAGVYDLLLFIDEYSMVDNALLDWIFKLCIRCKIVFIGDPGQLTGIKQTGIPVYDANFTGAMLTEPVRAAADSPITQLATLFRHTVNTGEWPKGFKPDGDIIRWVSKDDFRQAIEAEFSRPDWKYRDSKILAWTNKRVIDYNHYVRNHVKGDPHFGIGDYAVCNSFTMAGKHSIKTDQLVCITGISDEEELHGVIGKTFTLDYLAQAFMPNSLEAKKTRIKQARENGEFHLLPEMEERWIDLRAAFAQTINKSQGSTYGEVFIDLDDIARCHNGNQIARMLYVAISRAKYRVWLTGDLA